MSWPPDTPLAHRVSTEVISHAVWLYHVFTLSLRNVELVPGGTRRDRLLRSCNIAECDILRKVKHRQSRYQP